MDSDPKKAGRGTSTSVRPESLERVDAGPIPLGVTLDGKFHVERVLGCGSMGIVYLGGDIALERQVAIKVLRPRYAADERVAQRFKREAVAMAAVRAENVVQIFSYGEYEKHPYFVMEYVPGYTVASLIERANGRDEQLYLDVVLGILRQVGRGLQAVHDAGIVHRDVKPANMLIGPHFNVAITDFGLVETLDGSSKRDLAGTPLYLAPELILRQQLPEEHRFRSDIYALGISTYEMLTGDVPFDGATIKEILRRHVEDTLTPLAEVRSDLPPEIDGVLARALDKDPEARFCSCGDFINALEDARHGVAFEAPPTGRLRVLVVDDDKESRTIFSTALKVAFPNAIIHSASDGLSALELARSSTVDLAVVDLNMPRMNGMELCAALRGDELTAKVPLVVVSADLASNDQKLLAQLGIEKVLRKPVPLSQLVEVARRVLERGNRPA